MNKKLISLAVAAAMAAPMAAAADIKMFGKMNLSYGAIDDSVGPTTIDDNVQLRSHASRLGFKGSEDLGGGLKAKFHLEWQVNPDSGGTGGDGLSRRNQFIGLAGSNWGEVRFGRHDLPLKLGQGKFDQFNDIDGDMKGVLAVSQGENRVDNVLAYLSPNFNGFKFMVAGVPGEESGPSADRDSFVDTWSLMGSYTNGPLFVSLGYDDYGDTMTGSGDIESLWRIVGTYMIAGVQVGAFYEQGKDEGSVGDKDVWGLSGKYKFGNNAIKAQYLDGDEDATGSNTEETQWSLGFDHYFSKRTNAYFVYTDAEEDKAGTGSDRDYQFYGVGMIHKF